MPKTKQSSDLASWNKRRALDIGKRYQELLASGQYLGYKRPTSGAGSWYARRKMGDGKYPSEVIGTADDGLEANGTTILSYAQARVKAVEWCQHLERRALEGEPTGRRGPFTVADAMEAYFRDGERRGMKGIVSAKSQTKAWILPTLGDIEVTKLSRRRIENWLDSVANSPRMVRSKAGCKQAFAPPPDTEDKKRARKDSANRVLTTLKAALTFALKRQLVEVVDPCWQKVEPYRQTTSSRLRFLQPDEAARLVNVCPPDFRELVEGALLTGCRYGELTRLRCKDYNASNSTIYVSESKSGKPRHVILTPQGVALFNALTAAKRSPEDLIFTRRIVCAQTRDSEGKFDSANQEYRVGAWGSDHQARFMAAACQDAELEPITFHELRHSYASMLVNAGCPMIYIADQLGHSDTRMVEKHYGHIKDDAKRAAILATMPTLGIVEPAKVQKLRLG